MAHPPMPELLAVAGPSYSKGREDADVELSDKARELHGHFMGGAAFCFAFGGRRAGASRRGH